MYTDTCVCMFTHRHTSTHTYIWKDTCACIHTHTIAFEYSHIDFDCLESKIKKAWMKETRVWTMEQKVNVLDAIIYAS